LPPRRCKETELNFKQLEYFMRVAELGSFTRAAAVLGIVQPALSRQVHLLSTELGQKLLVRSAQGVTPTEAGTRLLGHARGILHQVDRAREDLSRVEGALAGRVAIGMPPSIGKILVVALAREFNARLPQAALSLSEGMSVRMQDLLTTGRLDIALLYDPAPAPDLHCVALLMEEDLYLVSPRSAHADSAPVALKALAAMPLVLPSRPNTIRMTVETQLAKLGLKPWIKLEIDAYASILDFVSQGTASAVLPKCVVEKLLKRDMYEYHLITQPRLQSKLMMATMANRITTLTQQMACETILQVATKVFEVPPASPRRPLYTPHKQSR
jgi:LysR family nitrogen assimilation transcriptional regulator